MYINMYAVDMLGKECKHVQMNKLPNAVISQFLKSEGSSRHPGSMDWSRVESKLASALMQFQREGVE